MTDLESSSRRGGWRQQAAQISLARRCDRSRSPRRAELPRAELLGVDASDRRSLASDNLAAKALLLEWSWLSMRGAALQRIASAVVAGGDRDHLLWRLSRLGNNGAQPQNINSQLITMFKGGSASNLVTRLFGSRQHCMVNPHDIFKFCFDASLPKFRRHWGADVAVVRKFWGDLLGTAAGRELQELHPQLTGKTVDDLETTLPLFLHNDAGPFTKKRSVFVLSFGSFLGIGSELEVLHVVATWVKKMDMSKPERVYDYLLESFGKLAEGFSDGEPLAMEGERVWCGIWLSLFSDCEFLQQELGMKGASNTEPCGFCPCNRTTIPFTELGASARWRQRRLTNMQFLARLETPRHPMSTWPIFNYMSPRFDGLHVVDYKGVLASIHANVLWTLVLEPGALPGGSQGERMRSLTERKDAFFSGGDRHQRIMGDIDKNLLFKEGKSSKAYPSLSGPGVKAANTRALTPWIEAIAIEFDDGSPVARHRRKVAVNAAEYLRLIYSSGAVLTRETHRRLAKVVLRCLRSYAWLCHNAISGGKLLWHITPKFHFWAEMVYQAVLLNPRFCQTYHGESMVGRVCAFYKRAADGPFHATIQYRFLRQYCIGLSIRLSNRLT